MGRSGDNENVMFKAVSGVSAQEQRTLGWILEGKRAGTEETLVGLVVCSCPVAG